MARPPLSTRNGTRSPTTGSRLTRQRVDAVPEPAATGSLVDDGHAFQPPESHEAKRWPPEGALDSQLRLKGQDLVFECVSERFGGERVAYRTEAVPEPEDEYEGGSPEAWAGLLVVNWKEALEADDSPPPGPPDQDGLRWLPA
jgi:hypothetical protein